MAATKKTTTAKAVETKATEPVKKIEAAPEAKALEAKVETPTAVENKAEVEAAPVQTAPAKEKADKTTKKAAATTTEKKKPGRKPKAAVKEETEETAVPKIVAQEEPAVTKAAEEAITEKSTKTKRTAKPKEEEIKSNIHLQYAGRSYTNEDLLKIAKDVWQYDLKNDIKDIKTVDLYVKPEENTVYYVFNGTVEGCFGI